MKPNNFIRFLSLILLLGFLNAGAQNAPLSTKSKKAAGMFNDAIDLYQKKEYQKSLHILEKATDEDPGFVEAYILKGDILSEEQHPLDAVIQYKKGLAADPEYSPNLYFVVANVELLTGRYTDARKDYEKFLTYPNQPKEKQAKASRNLKSCDFGINAMAHPVPFKPKNLGDSINSAYDEYVNAITPDEQRLYFTRKLPRGKNEAGQYTEFNEDFYCATKKDSTWNKARNLGPPINTVDNEGALCISPDGKFIFFAACNRPEGFGSCDIYWSRNTGGQWSEPENLGPVVNSGAWDSQPSFSSDGKTLYFASKRAGGKGSSDIWKTELKQDGSSWSVPVNLGDSINTPQEEMAPFIHPDDRTLYFSSRGHPGMGGFDLYYSRKDADGNWTNPVDLGYPINSYADEITLVVSAHGDVAYISSDKPGGHGGMDIYSFKLYKEAQPVLVTYFKGMVYDKETNLRLEAKFELVDLSTGKVVSNSSSDPVTGEFLLSLPTEKEYGLNVSRPGYLFYSDHFELRGEHSKAKPFIYNVPLQPIRIGETVILKNIFFDTDKFNLKPESMSELSKLLQLLKSNPTIHIEISGHTDNQGTAEHNLILSMNRALAVYDYLVGNGIGKDRLTYAGYGLTRPIDSNDSEQGRSNNRRTEFKVVGQ
jgi:outer membrane protein OmpA-like peptidoglycan-associated protein/Tol biopolymer transport system component